MTEKPMLFNTEMLDSDAYKEGIEPLNDIKALLWHDGLTPVERFSKLWDSIYEKRGYGWDTNCWVWVYDFERVK